MMTTAVKQAVTRRGQVIILNCGPACLVSARLKEAATGRVR
ncbi:hypothetical protein [Streptomyces sp. NPDC007991]